VLTITAVTSSASPLKRPSASSVTAVTSSASPLKRPSAFDSASSVNELHKGTNAEGIGVDELLDGTKPEGAYTCT
jgi:hypothetical protein